MFYFCSYACLKEYNREPEKYIGQELKVDEHDRVSENCTKKITAYVNTYRIHWLIEELQNKGVNGIMVTEFFRPNSQISKDEFLCNDEDV